MKAAALILLVSSLVLGGCATPRGGAENPQTNAENKEPVSPPMVAARNSDMEVYDMLDAFIQVFSIGRQDSDRAPTK